MNEESSFDASSVSPYPAASSHPDDWLPPSPEELQQQIPNYKVLDLLGRGGMGAVYKGWQVSLERHVAIKILPPDMDDGEANFAARFRQEAKTMAKLQHPGIVAVIDAGGTATGLLYFVMEFIEGVDVAQMLKQKGRLDPNRALEITAHVCDALHYAHTHGVIHRDIKPANIMVNKDGLVKVADFGLAKAAGTGGRGLTRTDMSVGTPDFIAPEALTLGVMADHRADLYAVGVMLYQMLSGEVPRGKFKRLSQKAGTDPRFDAIVDKAMEQERELRYQSARDIRRDLDLISSRPMQKVAPPADALQPTVPLRKPPPQQAFIPGLQQPPPKKSSPRLIAGLIGAAAAIAIGAFFTFKKSSGGANDTPGNYDAPVAVGAGGSASKPAATVTRVSPLAQATRDGPFANLLGMKFVPVLIAGGPTDKQRVFFSVWLTREQDYEVFVKEAKSAWTRPEIEQEPTHPVVGPNWYDAQAFCAWLTGRERAAGRLGVNEVYRLPSDHEWSCAAEIGQQEDAAKLPAEKHLKIADVFPWGAQWPPPTGAANLAGEEMQPELDAGKFRNISDVLKGYNDGFVNTSPVGSFAANRFGLHDMAGNVWQWCEDWVDASQTARVLRGSSSQDSNRILVQSSFRNRYRPDAHLINHGFRCVLSATSPP